MAAIDELKTKTVLVYVDYKTEKRDTLPQIVREALSSGVFGKYVPMVVITDPDLKAVICNIPMESDSRKRKNLYREAKKKIQEWAKAGK
ncbi:MAG: hypothetical protein JXR37_04315 [Kiritimatiellae bacterium]|nr:hypothetical protein [Kiritimatiellia bacterium]